MTYSFNFLPSIMGNSLFTNVIVRPSTEQIEAATETLTYDENETFMNNQCPISLEDFRNGEQQEESFIVDTALVKILY